jgi:hypothetical protein
MHMLKKIAIINVTHHIIVNEVFGPTTSVIDKIQFLITEAYWTSKIMVSASMIM